MARRFLTYNVNGRGVLQPHDNVSDENTMTRRFVTYNVEDQKAGLIPVDEKGVLQPHEGAGSASGGFPNGTVWTETDISFSAYPVISYGDGVWVACAKNGVYYSENGKTWEICCDETFATVHYANGLWVGAKDSSRGLCYSNDGVTWKDATMDSEPYVMYLNYANGVWTAMGGGFHYSLDGKTWSLIPGFSTTASVTTSGYFTYFANGLWNASYTDKMYYSPDGSTWTASTGLTIGCNSILCENGIWVAATVSKGLYYSDDGITWTASNVVSGKVNALLCKKGVWVAAISNKGLYYSFDGKTWSASNIASGYYSHVNYADGLWIAGGDITNTGFYYSLDGKTWSAGSETAAKAAAKPIYNNGIWVFPTFDANYNSVVFWSSDGYTWAVIDGVAPVSNVSFEKCIWVAVGSSEKLIYSIGWEKA